MFDLMAAKTVYIRGDYSEAARLFHEGAREGDMLASFLYGYSLLYGIGVDPDPCEAKSYFVFSRDLEGGEACYNLAVMYMHGKGVGVNYKKSLEYMEASAALGCIEAQLYLGMAYTTGFWLEPDIVSISLVPYHTPDYRNSRELLLDGDMPDAEIEEDMRSSVVEADANRAFNWFRTAARHDPTYVGELVAKGQFLYAKCFIDGFGTEFDRTKGTRLMLLAGKNGSGEAIEFLTENGDLTRSLLGKGEN